MRAWDPSMVGLLLLDVPQQAHGPVVDNQVAPDDDGVAAEIDIDALFFNSPPTPPGEPSVLFPLAPDSLSFVPAAPSTPSTPSAPPGIPQGPPRPPPIVRHSLPPPLARSCPPPDAHPALFPPHLFTALALDTHSRPMHVVDHAVEHYCVDAPLTTASDDSGVEFGEDGASSDDGELSLGFDVFDDFVLELDPADSAVAAVARSDEGAAAVVDDDVESLIDVCAGPSAPEPDATSASPRAAPPSPRAAPPSPRTSPPSPRAVPHAPLTPAPAPAEAKSTMAIARALTLVLVVTMAAMLAAIFLLDVAPVVAVASAVLAAGAAASWALTSPRALAAAPT